MPLKAPTRLPRSLRRTATPYTRSLARQFFGGGERRARRRREKWARWMRQLSRLMTTLRSEFRAWLLIGTAVIAVTVALSLLFAPFFDVREIRVRRQDPRVDPEEVQILLKPLFNQRLVLVSKSQVMAMLRTAYPDLDRVEVTKTYPSTLSVTIYLEPVVATVALADDGGSTQTGSALTGSGGSAYITRSGLFVVSPIAITPSTPLTHLTFTDWETRPQNRTQVISADLLKSVFIARDILRTEFGLQIKSITVYLRAQEFHIRTATTTLWFDQGSPVAVQLQRFREFLKLLSLDLAKQYIDLRITNKILYQ